MNHCNCKSNSCDPCRKLGCDAPCNSPEPFLGIEALSDNLSVLRFNIDGKRTDYDFADLIFNNQTDTSLTADAVQRVLTYMAERHTDSITARELGAIFHLADIGDVSTEGAKDGSLLVYKKSSNCGEGCTGIGDTWQVWNALDQQVSSATYAMVFSQDGKAQVLERPQNPSGYYQLGWNGGDQLSYSKVPIVSVAPTNSQGTKTRLYLDENTNQIVAVRES